jgi:hypothetical protein
MLNVPKEIADEPMNMALSGKNRKSYERTPELIHMNHCKWVVILALLATTRLDQPPL